MPTAYTPNLDLNLPEIGASRDTWGALVNANFSTLDSFVSMAMPVGAVLDFAGSSPPSGWLIADGRLVSRMTYSALFAAIGTAWGSGDGSTTFGLPNLCGRSSVGPGTVTGANGSILTLSFSQQYGSPYNPITQANLPNYAISTDAQGYHSHSGYTSWGGAHGHTADYQGTHSHFGATGAGGDHTHSGTTDWQGSHWHHVYVNTFGGGGSNGQAFAGGQQGNQDLGYYTDTQGNHYHNLSINNSGTFQLPIYADGNHTHTISWAGDHNHPISGDGSHSHTIYLGGSSVWFPVVQPIIVVTKLIYAGEQAAARVTTDVAPLHVVEGESDELRAIREELAQLRAMVGLVRGPAQQRRLQAPLRGPH